MDKLSAELWDRICREAILKPISSYDKFDLETAEALAGTNKQFRRIALPWVYRNIDISTSEELHKFYLLLRAIPESRQLVKTFGLSSEAWVTDPSWNFDKEDPEEELLSIGSFIGRSLDEFSYCVGWEPFNDTSEFDCLLPLFRHARSVSIDFTCTSLDKHFRLLQVLLANAENIEEFTLAQIDGQENEPVYSFRPEPLPSTLKRLDIRREVKPGSLGVTSCFAVWISRLHSLEKLRIPHITYGEPGLNNLIRSFHIAGTNLRELDIGSFRVPLPGDPRYVTWERGIFTILRLCPRLIKLRLGATVHARSQLFDHLPKDLEYFRYEFTIDPISLDAVVADPGDEENFIAAFKTFVEERKSKLKKLWISHGLKNISKDMNIEVIDFVGKSGVAEVAFGYYAG